MLQVKYEEEIKKERDKQARITQNYREFLDSLDTLKRNMLKTFTDMPPPMVHIVYNYAMQIADDMWKNADEHVKQNGRVRFNAFLSTVFADTKQVMLQASADKLPTKTMELIEGGPRK